jgi:regulatory protein CII
MLSLDENAALKAATRRLIKQSGGQEACVSDTRIVRHQSFSQYGAPDWPEKYMPLDVAFDLERQLGLPVVTAHQARALNHVLVPMPAATGPGPVLTALGKTGEEVGQVFTKAAEALRDGRITEPENKCVAREIDEALVALVGLKLAVSAATDGGEGSE